MIEKYKQRFDKHNDQFETLIFFEFLVGFLAKDDVKIFSHSTISQDLFFRSLHKNIKLICSSIIEINNQINRLGPNRLSRNQISRHSIYTEYSDVFDRCIKVLKNHFDGLSKLSLDLENRLNLIIEKAEELINKYNEFVAGIRESKNHKDMPQNEVDSIFFGHNCPGRFDSLRGLFGIGFSKQRKVILEQPLPECLKLFVSKIKEAKNIDDESKKIDEIITVLELEGFLVTDVDKFMGFTEDSVKNGDPNFKEKYDLKYFIIEIKNLIKAIQNSTLKRNKLSIPQLNNSNHLTHLKQTFLVSKIVQEYKPPSIDYFMTNLEFFAPYEFWNKKDNAYFEMDESSKKERKELILLSPIF